MTEQHYDLELILDGMISDLQDHLAQQKIEKPLMVGIHTAGVWLAQELHKRLGLEDEPGELNINFYRDDFSRNGLHPQISPSKLPLSIEDRHIILVDDVLYTGRTIRAAMNEIFDYGRPASIILVILYDREGRELPIEAQITGIRRALHTNQYIELSGPQKLELNILEKA